MTAPNVKCVGCSREVACVRVSDGTVYRPFEWAYPYPDPLKGLCGECQAKVAAGAFLETATRLHLAQPEKSTAEILEEAGVVFHVPPRQR